MKKWQNSIIHPEASLREAISVVDSAGLRIGLVVDNDGLLLGTLTDGDIRRALLKHSSLGLAVKEVMCAAPRVARIGWSRDKLRSVMEEADLLQMPLLDEKGHVVGLETLHGLMERRVFDNPVFLMAGGFGKRLRPLTDGTPKPLLKVGDKAILELIIERLAQAGFFRFFISTHYLPELIIEYFGDGSRWGVSIEYIHENTPLGTGGALGLLPKERIDRPLLMMNGDLLTTVDYCGLLEFHADQGTRATMCVREYEHQIPFGVVEPDGTYVRQMREKPLEKYFINAGIYVVSPELVQSVMPGVRVDMPELLERELASERKVSMFPMHEYWLDIGQIDDFRRAQCEVRGLDCD
jgi:dTDP-glucose pyrophosphorylase